METNKPSTVLILRLTEQFSKLFSEPKITILNITILETTINHLTEKVRYQFYLQVQLFMELSPLEYVMLAQQNSFRGVILFICNCSLY